MNRLATIPLTRARLFFRTNILLGFVVTAVAVFLMATGHYTNIQQREASEAVLVWTGIGGLIYMAMFLSLCVFKYDIFNSSDS